jgi:hypothetical protein
VEGISSMENENKNKYELGRSSDVFYLEDLFFVREETIRMNDELVQKSFQDLYKCVNYN